jgi:hypothetical protein
MTRILAIPAVAAAVLMACPPAHAQYAGVYGSPAPQPYAVEVAPGTYVIQHPSAPRAYPYVGCTSGCAQPARPHRYRARTAERPHHRNDPALIEELRRRSGRNSKSGGKVVNTTRIVRDPPVIIEHRRVVDDPPRVVVRRHYVEDAPRRPRVAAVESDAVERGAHRRDDGRETKRVIRAEAEVTILGPDRMSIRLFRKRGTDAKAEAE